MKNKLSDHYVQIEPDDLPTELIFLAAASTENRAYFISKDPYPIYVIGHSNKGLIYWKEK